MVDLDTIQGLLARGRLLQALEAAKGLAGDPARPPAERVRGWLLATRAASLRDLHVEARICAEQAHALAAAAGDSAGAALATLYRGQVCLQAGDWGEAEGFLLAFMGQVEVEPDLRGYRADACYQLAMCYEGLKRPEPALHLYQQAAELAHGEGQPARSLTAHQNAAWLALRLGDQAVAEHHLSRAALLLAAGQDSHRTNQIALEAVAHLRQGDQALAVQSAEEVLMPGCPGARPWSRTCAAWVAGEVAMEQGRSELAAVMVGAALREVVESRDVALMNYVTDLRRRVHVASQG